MIVIQKKYKLIKSIVNGTIKYLVIILVRSSDQHNEFKMNGVTPEPHTYYQVLIDQRDCPYVVFD